MRIRNKLITVQLIMTITLILSIIIFSIHMYSYVQIDNAEMVISQLDSSIFRYKLNSDTALNRRKPTLEIKQELERILGEHNIYIQFFQNSSLYSSALQKEKIRELSIAYISVKNNSSREFLNALEEADLVKNQSIISDIGINKTLKLLKTTPEEAGLSHNNMLELSDNINNIYMKHILLRKAYDHYFSTWIYSKDVFEDRLETLKSRSIIRTISLIIIILILAFYINYKITNKITLNLNEVNRSLSKMTAGDFTSTLHIAAGDEFGDLSRNFNTFIEQLWKKLDSMNVIMHDIGHAMNDNLNLNKIQINILNNVTNHINSDSAGILMLKDGELKLTASKGHFPPFFPIEDNLSNDRPEAARYLKDRVIPLDIPIINECLNNDATIIVRDCSKDKRFPQSKNVKSALYINSIMLVPLTISGKSIGIFVVMRTGNKKQFSDLDYTNFSSFSDYAALTIDTLDKYNELLEKFEMQKEIGVAADIQQSLVPGKMPKIKGISSSAYTLAAKGVSGDYYDFFRMNKHTIGATVCDVAGKGVPASLVMVMIRTILRLVSSPLRGAAETLTMLNKSICGKIDVDRYATMAFFKIDLLNMKLNYSNAAHHPIQIFRPSTGKFYAIDSPGLPIGIDRDCVFTEKRVSLNPGDIIFMYTDGFPEARNHDGDEYSTNRMLREIRLHSNSDADKILDSVVSDMQKFTSRASQHDDQTILIIKIDEDK